MKVLYRNALPSLIASLLLMASCAPKYGAHFAPSKHTQRAVGVETHEISPLLAEEAKAQDVQLQERGLESGAAELVTDVAPSAEVSTITTISPKQQRKALRELRDKLKGMSEAERLEFQQQVLHQLRQQQTLKMAEDDQTDRGTGNASVSTVLLVILAVLLPPLAVFLHQGEINTKFWISLVLSLLFWVPGIIYAMLVIFGVV